MMDKFYDVNCFLAQILLLFFLMKHKEFEKFQATVLFCPKCNMATEVKERLLLVLPDGNLFDYLCSLCGTSVGKKKDSDSEDKNIIIASG